MNYQEILKQAEKLRADYKFAEKHTPYAKTQAQINKIYDKIEELNRRKDILCAKAEKQQDKHWELMAKLPYSWGDTVLEPIAKELMKLNPTLTHYEVLGSFGLNCEYGLWLFTDEDYAKYSENNKHDTRYITYSLHFQDCGNVWIGEYANRYEKGSIGEINGGNKVVEPIESIEQLNSIMHKLKEQEEQVRLTSK